MLRRLVVGYYQANCYIMGDEATAEGVVIDPGDEVFRIAREITNLGLNIKYILLTHGHFDHVEGAYELRNITGAPVLIHPLDAGGLRFDPDGALSEGMHLYVGNYDIEVIHTPGHTAGSVCFYTDGVVFTGDTLFAGSVGRTFSQRDHYLLVQNVIQKIFPLGDDVRVYPGHGPPTTIGRERLTNPFFQ
ncbi:MAG: MBL fold metallo-hydrolase [Deltaproteobacteria bacterium]|nr:MAG: MBL fold metallo-hydrolase [Deltaproteobacteria bacterium]